mmetsp:Transcript_18393/g.22516  ORF Transcript_18393/g.22516 Transcript_18393/m.22516 type:complete len:142 (-) Transcript_18393:243-668(-)
MSILHTLSKSIQTNLRLLSSSTATPTLSPTLSYLSNRIQQYQNQNNQTTNRTYWREVLRILPDPKNPNKTKVEDIDKLATRSWRAQRSEGLLPRRMKYRNYLKPWMQRKRQKEVKKYKSMEKGVSNLKKYVKFINDYKIQD